MANTKKITEEKKIVKKAAAKPAAKPVVKKTTVKAEPEKTIKVTKTVAPTGVDAKVKKDTGSASASNAASASAAKANVADSSPVSAKASQSASKTTKSLSVDVFGMDGKVSGKVSLPAEIFGEKVNKTLLAQAVRVYLANKRQGNASTKTRGEVEGSTRKIYRQKGTGRARHGSIRAPLFVHGGVVFGPKPRDYSMDMPKKMRRKALFSALSSKLAEGELKVLSGLEKMNPKTKEFIAAMNKLGIGKIKTSMLLVLPAELENVRRATQNVPGVRATAANRLNAYDVLKSRELVLMQDAVNVIEKTFLAKE